MSTAVQRRRGTTAQHASFAGLEGELTVDTTKDTLVVHDGATTGGRPLLREDQTNLPTSAPTTGIYNASGSLGVATNGTGRLFVDASGNVLLGRSTLPSAGWPVAVNLGLTAASSDNSIQTQLWGHDGAAGVGTYTNTAFQFRTNNSERMRLDTSGRLGIGTSAPATTLDVNGDATIYGIRVGRGAGAFDNNTVVGNSSLLANTSGQNNTAIGITALRFNTTGYQNTAVGGQALYTNTTGAFNTAYGINVLYRNESGDRNVAIGVSALVDNTTGSYNTCVGNNAGSALTTGSNNTIIGNILGTAGLADTVIIGAGSTERLRIDSSGRVGIGTTAPSQLLELNGASNPCLLIKDTTNNVIAYTFADDSVANFGSASAHPVVFRINNNEAARIDTSNRLLVGTSSAPDTAANTKLQVQGDVYFNGLSYAPGKNYAQTSTSGSTSIVDTGLALGGGALYEMAVTGNAAPGGSSAYRNIIFGYVSIMVDFSFGSSSVQATIAYDQTFAKNGSIGSFTVSAVFWNGSSENTTVAQANWGSNQIRVKVAGSGGSSQEVRLRRIL